MAVFLNRWATEIFWQPPSFSHFVKNHNFRNKFKLYTVYKVDHISDINDIQ
jgi:hypothetical protein